MLLLLLPTYYSWYWIPVTDGSRATWGLNTRHTISQSFSKSFYLRSNNDWAAFRAGNSLSIYRFLCFDGRDVVYLFTLWLSLCAAKSERSTFALISPSLFSLRFQSKDMEQVEARERKFFCRKTDAVNRSVERDKETGGIFWKRRQSRDYEFVVLRNKYTFSSRQIHSFATRETTKDAVCFQTFSSPPTRMLMHVIKWTPNQLPAGPASMDSWNSWTEWQFKTFNSTRWSGHFQWNHQTESKV